jgi:hypothetical protein
MRLIEKKVFIPGPGDADISFVIEITSREAVLLSDALYGFCQHGGPPPTMANAAAAHDFIRTIQNYVEREERK